MKVTILVGTAKGAFLFSSDRARRRWRIEGPLFKGWKVTAASIGIGGGYVAATASDVYGPAIHRSDDLERWRQVEHGPAYAEDRGFKLKEIWKLAAAGDRLYAGVDEAGLFRSDDKGESWQLVDGLTSHASRPGWFPGAGGLCAHSILVDPRDPARVWCGISAVGVFRSDDFGATWRTQNDGVPVIIEDPVHKGIGYCVHSLAAEPNNPKVIYRQDHKGMFKSTDGGDRWQRIESGLPSGFGFPLAIDAGTRALYCVPLESDEYRMPVDGRLAVYRSRDGGGSWQRLETGLAGAPVYAAVLRSALAVDDLTPCGVYFGTAAGTLYFSADGGESWSARPEVLPRVLTVQAFVEE